MLTLNHAVQRAALHDEPHLCEAGQECGAGWFDDLRALRHRHLVRRPRGRSLLATHEHDPPRVRRRGRAVEHAIGLTELISSSFYVEDWRARPNEFQLESSSKSLRDRFIEDLKLQM